MMGQRERLLVSAMAMLGAVPAISQPAAQKHDFKLPGVTWEDISSDDKSNDNVLMCGLGVKV